MQGRGQIVFYGNSSNEIGAGHIMRMFALAQIVSEQYDVTFVYKSCTSTLLDKLHNEGFATKKVAKTLNSCELKQLKPVALVVDDYYLTADEWYSIANLGTYVVNFDDGISKDKLYADLVINPAADANIAEYEDRAPKAEFCLGPSFSYIRKEFSNVEFIPINQRKNILVTLGGTDSKSLALPICKALLNANCKFNIQLLLGKTHQEQAELERLQAQCEYFSIVLNPPSVSQYMISAGLAISAAGGTLGELASLGVPTIALVTVDNQVAVLNPANTNSWYKVFDFRKFESVKEDNYTNHMLLRDVTRCVESLWKDNCLRENMSIVAQQLVDTHGCRRIVDKLNKSIEMRYKVL